MGYKEKRKIVGLGAISRGIALPKPCIEFNNLVKGDQLMILGNSVLVITPPKHEMKARKLLELIEDSPSMGGS